MIDLHCAAEEVRAAATLVDDGCIRHVRGWADGPAHWVSYTVNFSPQDADRSEEVCVSTGGELRRWVTSRQLRAEPHRAVDLLVAAGDTFMTGTVVDLFRIGEVGPVWQVAVIAKSDTKKVRTRWHVTAPIDCRGAYGFLATGRRSGFVRLPDPEAHERSE